jgi:putative transposase
MPLERDTWPVSRGPAPTVADNSSAWPRQAAEAPPPPHSSALPGADFDDWRTRRLERHYSVLFVDSIPVRVKELGHLTTKRFHLALGILPSGTKDILAFWIDPEPSVASWSSAFLGLRDRGTSSLSIASVEDGGTCATALKLCFPRVVAQTSPVHLTRRAVAFVPAAERGAIAKKFGRMFTAPSASDARSAFEHFSNSALAKRHPSVTAFCRDRWEEVVGCFDLPLSVRVLIAGTTAIESAVEKLRRRGVERRTGFSSIDAAVHDFILPLRDATASWHVAPSRWLPVARDLMSLIINR